MAKIPGSNIRKEVDEYYTRNHDNYITLINNLQTELQGLRTIPKCANLIYSIYSRADRQRGVPLKDAWKTAEKLQDWRKEKGDTEVGDIHDIVGATIVVNYPSDRKILADFLQQDGSITGFQVVWCNEKEKDGYYAHHLKIKSNYGQFAGLFCEIQIKTMLHDGWGGKTHNLTYKPLGQIDEVLYRHMNILGDVLRLLDDQSEIIKEFNTRQLEFG